MSDASFETVYTPSRFATETIIGKLTDKYSMVPRRDKLIVVHDSQMRSTHDEHNGKYKIVQMLKSEFQKNGNAYLVDNMIPSTPGLRLGTEETTRDRFGKGMLRHDAKIFLVGAFKGACIDAQQNYLVNQLGYKPEDIVLLDEGVL